MSNDEGMTKREDQILLGSARASRARFGALAERH
jgi:hypothetical protein